METTSEATTTMRGITAEDIAELEAKQDFATPATRGVETDCKEENTQPLYATPLADASEIQTRPENFRDGLESNPQKSKTDFATPVNATKIGQNVVSAPSLAAPASAIATASGNKKSYASSWKSDKKGDKKGDKKDHSGGKTDWVSTSNIIWSIVFSLIALALIIAIFKMGTLTMGMKVFAFVLVLVILALILFAINLEKPYRMDPPERPGKDCPAAHPKPPGKC